MRTTITIDERLLSRLKQRATESGTSVSRLIEEAVQLSTRTPVSTAQEEEPFELITFGAGGRFSRHNMDKASVLLEAEDLERYGSRDQESTP